MGVSTEGRTPWDCLDHCLGSLGQTPGRGRYGTCCVGCSTSICRESRPDWQVSQGACLWGEGGASLGYLQGTWQETNKNWQSILYTCTLFWRQYLHVLYSRGKYILYQLFYTCTESTDIIKQVHYLSPSRLPVYIFLYAFQEKIITNNRKLITVQHRCRDSFI